MIVSEVKEAIRLQKLYCEFHMIPLFIPDDGICYNCYRQIFDHSTMTIKKASDELITGCPHCHYSFVE